jgi:hypothetical protein
MQACCWWSCWWWPARCWLARCCWPCLLLLVLQALGLLLQQQLFVAEQTGCLRLSMQSARLGAWLLSC